MSLDPILWGGMGSPPRFDCEAGLENLLNFKTLRIQVCTFNEY